MVRTHLANLWAMSSSEYTMSDPYSSASSLIGSVPCMNQLGRDHFAVVGRIGNASYLPREPWGPGCSCCDSHQALAALAGALIPPLPRPAHPRRKAVVHLELSSCFSIQRRKGHFLGLFIRAFLKRLPANGTERGGSASGG